MTKEDFRLLQQQHRQSGKSLKQFLIDEDISYSNYRYWNKKFNTENTPQPLAPITFTTSSNNASLSSPLTCDVPSGVTLLFPNGLKAHFGAGTEDLLKELLKQSLSAHVLS